MRQMTRKQMVAAEVFGYSYAHYADHLGIRHKRFEQLMPDDVDVLEKAEREGWDTSRLAKALDIDEEKIGSWQRSYREAIDIVDAPTPAESFRRGVRYSIQHATEQGLTDEASLERLVTQICFRAADLGYLLDVESKRLSDYSEALREETDIDLDLK